MTFKDIPGHETLKIYFNHLIRDKRVPHAFLLTGGAGHGKLGLCLAFIQLLLCESPSDEGACGTCPSCIKSKTFVHPDVHFAYPVIKKDGIDRKDTVSTHFINEWRAFIKTNVWGNISDWLESIGGLDKQANINVAECNHIIKKLGLKSFEGKYKVQVIWNAEYLGKEANRLLKLIEEPTDDTIIILISDNTDAILNTIRSRCQIVNIPPLQDSDIEKYLISQHDLDDITAKEFSYLASGNIRKAEKLALQESKIYAEELLEWLRRSYTGDPEKLVEWVDHLAAKGKQELTGFLSYGLHFLREYFLGLETKSTEGLRLTTTEKNSILKMQRIIDKEKTLQLERIFSSTIPLIRRNLSIKVLMMDLSIKINSLLSSEVNNFSA